MKVIGLQDGKEEKDSRQREHHGEGLKAGEVVGVGEGQVFLRKRILIIAGA